LRLQKTTEIFVQCFRGTNMGSKAVSLEDIRFMVVEDNSNMRGIIKLLLSNYGCRHVMEASDGADAMEKMFNNQPDIVITDVEMPLINGFELIDALRKDDSIDPCIPIIMVTGHPSYEVVMKARNAGVNEMLCKPVSAKDLYVRVMSCLCNPREFIKTDQYFGPDRRRHLSAEYKGKERRQSLREKLESVNVERTNSEIEPLNKNNAENPLRADS
jgi:two-component system chemotaxis response regulator CheY